MREISDLNLGERLHVLRMTDSGIMFQAVANQFETSVSTVAVIVQSRSWLKNFCNPQTARHNLALNENIKLLHNQEKHRNATLVGSRFKGRRKTLMHHWMNREKILDMVRREHTGQVKRPLKAKHPEIDNEVVDFIRFTRHSRLPVTSGLVKFCARKSAVNNGIHDFSASNGWLGNFVRRSSIQPSFKFLGKVHSELPPTTAARMREICNTVSKYSPANVYNVDESGLFYRMGLSRTYLLAEENRAETRVTSMQNHKNCITIVLCVNADGSHKIHC